MRTSQPAPPVWTRWVFLAIAVAFCALVVFVAFRIIARL